MERYVFWEPGERYYSVFPPFTIYGKDTEPKYEENGGAVKTIQKLGGDLYKKIPVVFKLPDFLLHRCYGSRNSKCIYK